MADDPIAEKGLDTLLADLETVVRQLEAGDLPLEESMKLFERGMELSNRCHKQLDEAEHRVEILIKKGNKVRAEPMPDDPS